MQDQEQEQLKQSTVQVHKMIQSWIPIDYQVKDKIVQKNELYSGNSKVVGSIKNSINRTLKKKEISKSTREIQSSRQTSKVTKVNPLKKYGL
jgi:hypothetical protein